VAKVLREGVYEPDSPEVERRSRPPLVGDHSKIQVIQGGIDTGRFRPLEAAPQRKSWGLQPGNVAFGVVGGYDLPRGKGQREFLKAAARIHARVPEARFLIIGRGSLREALLADIASLGLDKKAWLTPYSQDMPTAMNALDCLVHPQVGTEAFPGVVLEAFACGKPVIASALDGIPEGFAVGNCGQLVPPEDIGALADALLAHIRKPPLTMAERQQLHERVAGEFAIVERAKRVLELYQRLLAGPLAEKRSVISCA
jgi:glycosyltransferase involved in cell wall biosynthesis